jgi:hypothetical protein
MKKVICRSFRPKPQIQERLDWAASMGVNISEVINEVLDKHLEDHIQEKANRILEQICGRRQGSLKP